MAGENERRILQRDTNPHLFRPLKLRGLTVKNRIMMSPMCQYSAEEGVPGDWHFAHIAARAAGGAAIACIEATAIERRGRITYGCTGIWNDAQRDAFKRITDFVSGQGAVPAIQLAHSGRKGSVSCPWEGTKPLSREQGAWEVFGPAAVSHGDDRPPPRVMDRSLIDEVIDAYAAAARRSREAGFRLIEMHAAHGYLIHSFLSPLSNRREDEYGGSLQNRARMLMRAIAAIRAEWPAELPLGVRLSFSDWVEGGFGPDEAVEVCRMLKASGEVDFVACSSGGTSPLQKVPTSPGYQVPFAERARREGGIASVAVGLISAPEQAEEILANGRADLVALGRILLYEPHWPLHAAKVLKAASVAWPVQYERANIF